MDQEVIQTIYKAFSSASLFPNEKSRIFQADQPASKFFGEHSSLLEVAGNKELIKSNLHKSLPKIFDENRLNFLFKLIDMYNLLNNLERREFELNLAENKKQGLTLAQKNYTEDLEKSFTKILELANTLYPHRSELNNKVFLEILETIAKEVQTLSQTRQIEAKELAQNKSITNTVTSSVSSALNWFFNLSPPPAPKKEDNTAKNVTSKKPGSSQ
jgi:hypothetical protein